MAGAGAVVAGVVQIGQTVAVSHVSRVTDLDAGRDRDALGATWNALFGDLRTAALVVAVGGIAVAAVAAGVTQPSGLARRARRAATAVARPTPVRRGLLVAAGLVCLAAPAVALRGLVLALGAASLLFGLEGIAGRLTARSARSRPARRDGVLAAVAVVIVVGALAAAGAAALDAPAVPRAAPATAAGCNGSVANCDRRINDVVWPATHNSYAASDQAGWYFANQTRGIGRQLDDGIRGFLIDVHDGVRDARTGRVRTDVHAEGTTRNKVAEQLSPQALRLADRLAGRVGAGELRGRREPYLCHTLCEIGAEPLDDELTVIRRFLEGHPRQVLMVVVEPYVGPGVVEAALRRTRLLPYLAELDREEPLPTLGDLIAAGKRLVVFSEADGGARPWYMPAFSFMQDTPLGARRPADLRCARYRGTADSPILLMNHWIDRFPPRASQNARIGRSPFLRDRIDRCAAARGQRPAVIAVDFYERTSVVAVARDLNR